MENATEALIMAFSVIIFVIALSVSVLVFSKVREVSDVVVSATDQQPELEDQSTFNNVINYRIVGMETIIPVLYRYYKEETTIVFLQGAELVYEPETGNVTGVNFDHVTPLRIYNTTGLDIYGNPDKENWGASYYKAASDREGSSDADDPDYDPVSSDNNPIAVKKFYSYKINHRLNSNDKEICVIDLADEVARAESWVGNNNKIKEHVKTMITSAPLNDSSKKYVEIISTVTKDRNASERTAYTSAKKTTTRTIITYIRIG